MAEGQLPIEAFAPWAVLNDVTFEGVKLQDIKGKGFGLVANGHRQGETSDDTSLLKVPHDLVLSVEAVEDYAKTDQDFKQLLDVVGRESSRKTILLYLLLHSLLPSRKQGPPRGGVPTAWTEYIKFLPRDIAVPTLWNEEERSLLRTSSLWTPLQAKIVSLTAEFEDLREKSEDLPFWRALFWNANSATLEGWFLADAWYRSRCLELPQSGEAMVPGLDMVNHFSNATARYEERGDDEVVLLMRPGCQVSAGEEITISYGENKSAAEMLFSYGFIDDKTKSRDLTLHISMNTIQQGDPNAGEDPLLRVKFAAFKEPPTLKLSAQHEKGSWQCPFAYFLCLNEEDGLDFRILQDKTGDRELRVFWQEEDVTDRVHEFEALVQGHDLCQIYKLRTVATVHQWASSQLEAYHQDYDDATLQDMMEGGALRKECVQAYESLKTFETDILAEAVNMLDEEKETLLQDETVLAYLGQMEDATTVEAPESLDDDQDELDFS